MGEFGRKKYYIVMGTFLLTLSCIIAGAILLPFYARVPGRYHREQGICRTNTERLVYRLSGKGRAYRPVWSVSVFEPTDVNLTTPIFTRVAGFQGDLSSIQPFYTSESKADSAIDNYPGGTVLNCVYPANPLKYPDGGSPLDTRAVFLGDYTQSQLDSAYHKAQAMKNAGIALIVIGGTLILVSIGFLVYRCFKSPY